MAPACWPLADLSITVGELRLRPLAESDLDPLARALPDDVELNPDATVFAGADPAQTRATIAHQDYWRARGTWTADAWRLPFGVWRADELLGMQELEGTDFGRLREVDTASYLVASARGRGFGTQMRRGVLALAFGALGARTAITSAWPDNHASLGVSRRLGYRDNGVVRHRRGDGVDDMVRLRLTRAEWEAGQGGAGVRVGGVEPCLPYFGVHP